MMRPASHLKHIYLHQPPIDFRKGIQGLSSWVAAQMDLDLFQSALFVFINRRHNALKILYWDQTGFCLWHKQLDKAQFYWPKAAQQQTLCINGQQLNWLLDGCNIDKIQAHQALHYDAII